MDREEIRKIVKRILESKKTVGVVLSSIPDDRIFYSDNDEGRVTPYDIAFSYLFDIIENNIVAVSDDVNKCDEIAIMRNGTRVLMIPTTDGLRVILKHVIGITSYTKIKKEKIHELVDELYGL